MISSKNWSVELTVMISMIDMFPGTQYSYIHIKKSIPLVNLQLLELLPGHLHNAICRIPSESGIYNSKSDQLNKSQAHNNIEFIVHQFIRPETLNSKKREINRLSSHKNPKLWTRHVYKEGTKAVNTAKINTNSHTAAKSVVL